MIIHGRFSLAFLMGVFLRAFFSFLFLSQFGLLSLPLSDRKQEGGIKCHAY
jgi:hypothetical protein